MPGKHIFLFSFVSQKRSDFEFDEWPVKPEKTLPTQGTGVGLIWVFGGFHSYEPAKKSFSEFLLLVSHCIITIESQSK